MGMAANLISLYNSYTKQMMMTQTSTRNLKEPTDTPRWRGGGGASACPPPAPPGFSSSPENWATNPTARPSSGCSTRQSQPSSPPPAPANFTSLNISLTSSASTISAPSHFAFINNNNSYFLGTPHFDEVVSQKRVFFPPSDQYAMNFQPNVNAAKQEATVGRKRPPEEDLPANYIPATSFMPTTQLNMNGESLWSSFPLMATSGMYKGSSAAAGGGVHFPIGGGGGVDGQLNPFRCGGMDDGEDRHIATRNHN